MCLHQLRHFFGIAQVFHQIAADVGEGVQTTKICYFQRSKTGVAESKSIFHDIINTFCAHDPLRYQSQRLPEYCELKPVCGKSRNIPVYQNWLFPDFQT